MPPYKCPICNGCGMVDPGMQTTSAGKETCKACNGSGVVWGD